MVGKLAVSLAGHDKGSIFLVIREDGDVIWLAELEDLFQNPADADTKIKRCIKLYSMEKANERR